MTYFGHEQLWREWRHALASPRMHHAWILAGRRGIGKMGFALAAARELVAETGVPQPTGDHPDVVVLSHLPASADDEKKREDGKLFQVRRNITIDQVRSVQQCLTTRPTLGSRRAIVIDPVDDLETNASNALLKSLEEPPAGSFFLLISHRPGRLLPTIRSRCRLLRFLPLDATEIDAILQRKFPEADPQARAAAVTASGGSPGAALRFVELELGKIHTLMKAIAEEGDPDFTRRGALAELIGARPDRERQLAAIDLARAVLAHRVSHVSRASVPALTAAYAELDRLSAQAPTYNFDPGLLIVEVGTLLASVALRREAAHV